MRVENHKMEYLRGKKIALVKVVWEGLAGGSMTCEFEGRMRESYLELFSSCNFLERKFSKWGRVVTPQNLINLFDQIIRIFI